MRIALVLAALVLALLTRPGRAADPEPTLDLAALDAEVLARMADADIPGVAVAITHGDEIVHVRGYGHDADGAPITEDTPFRVASVSKSFTAMAVMQLVDDGRIALDDPVVMHLPEFAPRDPRARRITVRQLLDQTSGMSDRGFPEVSRPQPRDAVEAVARLADAELVAEPGTAWNYHNPNSQVAARLVEVVGGMAFAEALQRRIFAPLGMRHAASTLHDDDAIPGLARGHTYVYGVAVAVEAPGYFVAGSGGVVASASDLARWLIAQTQGGIGPDGTRIVSAAAVRTMHTPSAIQAYGLGWEIVGPPDRPTRIQHGGCCFAWSALQVLLPETGWGIAVLFDAASPLGADQRALAEAVVARVEGRTPSDEGPATRTIDRILGGITLAVIALAILGVRRARRWAARTRARRRWRVVLAAIVHVPILLAALTFPELAGLLFGGRDITWFTTFYGWFALGVLVATIAVAEIAVTLARIVQWRRLAVRSPA